MTVEEAKNQSEWDSFLSVQTFRPFLQSWTMGEVYRDTGEEPFRLAVREDGRLIAVCQALLVPAKRGRHLSIPYGPVLSANLTAQTSQLAIDSFIQKFTEIARENGCSFIRMSPFWPLPPTPYPLPPSAVPSPLHLLAEHIWYLPLVEPDPWKDPLSAPGSQRTARTEDALLMGMRKTTRNLIRRAERDGVTIEASADPNRDIAHFLALHDETRQRHGFTPYSESFFRAQVRRFAERNECTLYLARFQGEVASASIHMHAFGETSYHHGASTHRLSKVPTSYLLQWTAIRDALKRGDRVYNFWGIAPLIGPRESDIGPRDPIDQPHEHNDPAKNPPKSEVRSPKSDHPFAGVTLFKTGFGGTLLPLVHCMDFPLSSRYHLTRAFEILRKWKRGF